METPLYRRFGTRVRAQIPLRITSMDPAASFSETCHTMVVNPRGCGIRFSRPLKAGLRVRVEGLPGGGSTTAHVASNLPPVQGSKYWLVGIGLDCPGNPWFLAPAPADWGTYASAPRFPFCGVYVRDKVPPPQTCSEKK